MGTTCGSGTHSPVGGRCLSGRAVWLLLSAQLLEGRVQHVVWVHRPPATGTGVRQWPCWATWWFLQHTGAWGRPRPRTPTCSCAATSRSPGYGPQRPPPRPPRPLCSLHCCQGAPSKRKPWYRRPWSMIPPGLPIVAKTKPRSSGPQGPSVHLPLSSGGADLHALTLACTTSSDSPQPSP